MQQILMPQLGETVAEGKITVWYKAVGDKVAAGESLFEIETDKTSMEVPTTAAGVLSEIRVAAGATVPVGTVVAVLVEAEATAGAAGTAAGVRRGPNGGAVAANAGAAATGVAQTTPLDPFHPVRTPERNFGPATLPNGIKVTPVARRLAVEAGVDLRGLVGSGPHGHIVAKDVQAAAGRRGAPAGGVARAVAAGVPAAGVSPAGVSAAAAPAAGVSAPGAPATDAALAAQVRAAFAGVPFEQLPLDGMRRTIARRMQEAKQSIPHFYLGADVAVDRLASVRTEINAQAAGAFKLSINDFVIRAVALGLQRVPQANAVWAHDSILRLRHSDVGVAVAVEGGLFTPVIRRAETKSMSAISAEMKLFAEQARSRTLKPADYQGGSISISNLGMYGVSAFSAIINPPQSAILAVGAAERRALEGPDGTVRFGSIMTLTLSCDHRVIDGALGAQLLAAIKSLLEAPLLLFA